MTSERKRRKLYMIDIIIVTHGEYGKAMLASSELIMGEQENVQAFGFYLGESVEHLRDSILQAISCTRKGSEILILTDMRSGRITHLNT